MNYSQAAFELEELYLKRQYNQYGKPKNTKQYSDKEESIMSDKIDSSMTIVVDDEQEITFNFFDVSSITKKGYKNDSNTGERYVIVGVSYNRKASSTVPMKEHDYNRFVEAFKQFVEYMKTNSEHHQLRAINSVMGDQISDIIQASVSEHINMKDQIEQNMLALQEKFAEQLENYTKQSVARFEKTQEDLEKRLDSVNELFEKLSKVGNLVDDFLVAEETVKKEEENTEY